MIPGPAPVTTEKPESDKARPISSAKESRQNKLSI
jgi:hypothetical protein